MMISRYSFFLIIVSLFFLKVVFPPLLFCQPVFHHTKGYTGILIFWQHFFLNGKSHISSMNAAELDRKIEVAAKRTYRATKQLYKKLIRKVRGNDVRYFNTTKRGDINDWRKQLHGLNKKEVGRTMKCVIAAMTIGTDVSSLFPDVISCMHNETLELKKLVYLY